MPFVTGTAIKIGKEQGSDGTLRIKGSESALEFDGSFDIGEKGKGTLDLQDGAQITTDTLTLGDMTGSEGVVSLDNAQVGGTTRFETTGELILGAEGKGVLNVAVGSRMDVGTNAVLAKYAGSHAEVNIQNLTSTWDIDGDLTVGSLGDATVTLRKGLVDVGGEIVLGEQAGSHGTLFVEDSEELRGLKISEGLVIGKAGHGMLSIVDGGKVDLSGFLSFDGIVILGQMQNSNGLAIIEGDDSELMATAVVVGERGTGSLNVNDQGHLLIHQTLELGKENGSHGTMEVTGNGSSLTVIGETTVGKKGAATLTLSDQASASLNGALNIGDVAGAGSEASKVILTGGATLTTSSGRNLSIGRNATLEVSGSEADFSNATLNGSSALRANLNVTASGKLEVNNATIKEAVVTIDQGGKLECLSVLDVADNSSVTVSGGGSQISRLAIARLGVNSNGTLSLDSGGSLHFLGGGGTFQIGNQGKLTMGAGTLVEMSAGTVNIQGTAEMIGGGSYINNAGGTIGVTGTLKIAAGSNGIRASTINVHSGGTIYAASTADQITGRINGKVNNAGTLIVGQSPGVLVIEGDCEQMSGGVLQLEIGGLTPGEQFDQLVVTGSAIVDGTIDLAIINSGGGFQLPTLGDQFSLLNAQGGITGAFDNVASLRSVAGGSLVDWSLEASGNELVLEAASITPLPDGDYNGNGVVDAADYTVWRNTLGGINLAADGNRDGVIDDLDYAVWKGNYGAGPGSGSSLFSAQPSSPAVPEPAAAWLLIWGVIIAQLWRVGTRVKNRK